MTMHTHCMCVHTVIGGGRTPSLFITAAFFQITAVFGGFAIKWPVEIKEILKAVGVFNFNWNLMFFSCHDPRPTFLENWVRHCMSCAMIHLGVCR